MHEYPAFIAIRLEIRVFCSLYLLYSTMLKADAYPPILDYHKHSLKFYTGNELNKEVMRDCHEDCLAKFHERFPAKSLIVKSSNVTAPSDDDDELRMVPQALKARRGRESAGQGVYDSPP